MKIWLFSLICIDIIIPSKLESSDDEKSCGPIKLAYYDLLQAPRIVKKWGAYHFGVLVCDIEIHFVRSPNQYLQEPIPSLLPGSGDVILFKNDGINPLEQLIIKNTPEGHQIQVQNMRRIKDHTMNVGTWMDLEQILAEVDRLIRDHGFRRGNYNLYKRNCAHFAKDLVEAIADTKDKSKIEWPTELIHTIKGAKILGKLSPVVKGYLKFKSGMRSLSFSAKKKIQRIENGEKEAKPDVKPVEIVEVDWT